MKYKGKLDRYHLVNYYLANKNFLYVSAEHQLIFSYFNDDKFSDVTVLDSFWRRIKMLLSIYSDIGLNMKTLTNLRKRMLINYKQ